MDNATELVLGFPPVLFEVLHLTGIMACFISFLASSGVILYLFITENRRSNRPFYKWTNGERLVVYLAVFDLTFSLVHSVDHGYMFVTSRFLQYDLCRILAFLIIQSVSGQWLVIIYTACSALLMVIFHRRLPKGRYDWKLIVWSTVPPFIFSSCGIIFGYYGQSEGW